MSLAHVQREFFYEHYNETNLRNLITQNPINRHTNHVLSDAWVMWLHRGYFIWNFWGRAFLLRRRVSTRIMEPPRNLERVSYITWPLKDIVNSSSQFISNQYRNKAFSFFERCPNLCRPSWCSGDAGFSCTEGEVDGSEAPLGGEEALGSIDQRSHRGTEVRLWRHWSIDTIHQHWLKWDPDSWFLTKSVIHFLLYIYNCL